ncbi:hypothetical protein CEXT_408241 [Caerostris extrusa]|uniref:Uncharacterized protein n=1 Tax=Caerostris extrusa TaxID=172846 RepID=A0AAV4NER2_CAEEX|nr:hypothetical protein CEXT_408241 [Caerostris extrusa]
MRQIKAVAKEGMKHPTIVISNRQCVINAVSTEPVWDAFEGPTTPHQPPPTSTLERSPQDVLNGTSVQHILRERLREP